ncbi:MAG: desulfoferrodoxin family protein [Candidatus Peregrinibacteria bacterium]
MKTLKTPLDPTSLTDSERKHIPHITIEGNMVTVVCGDGILHPMEEDHYIVYIELFRGDESLAKKMLNPGDEPKAVFEVDDTENLRAEELCNLHGIWGSL